jgi:TPP-dependent pyruvate/acetoin dehydrogenase alpha subunit
VNSQHPLEHLEEYMRRRGSWDEGWRSDLEVTLQAAIKKELTA